MTCKFVLKCIIREKWLVDNNELVKVVAETFSIYIYIYIYNKIYAMKVIRPCLHASCCA